MVPPSVKQAWETWTPSDDETPTNPGVVPQGLVAWLPDMSPNQGALPSSPVGRLEHVTYLLEEGLIGKGTAAALLDPRYFGVERSSSGRFAAPPPKRSWFKRVLWRFGTWLEAKGYAIQARNS